jgi:hypothetical protein
VCRDLRLSNLAGLNFTDSELAKAVWEMPISMLVSEINSKFRITEWNGVKFLTDSIVRPILVNQEGLELTTNDQDCVAASVLHGGPAENSELGGSGGSNGPATSSDQVVIDQGTVEPCRLVQPDFCEQNAVPLTNWDGGVTEIIGASSGIVQEEVFDPDGIMIDLHEWEATRAVGFEDTFGDYVDFDPPLAA